MIYGLETALADRVKNPLTAGHAHAIWSARDVPNAYLADGPELKSQLALWAAILADCFAVAGEPCLSTDKVRFEAWFKARFVAPAEAKAAVGLAAVDSAECKADLNAQQMASVGELYGFELALYSGRAVSEVETAGGAYGQPPHAMAGAIAAAKANKGNSGAKTLDALLMEARKSGDKSPVVKHLHELCNRLSNSKTMGYNGMAANRIQTFVNKSNNIRDDLAWILYHTEVRVKYMGRGLPIADLYDLELAMNAKDMADELRSKGLAPGSRSLAQVCLPKSFGSSDVGSIGLSASQVDSNVSSALTELSLVMKDLSGAVTSITRRMDKLEGGGGADVEKGPKCWHCQSTSHVAAECPSAKGIEHRRKRAEKEAAEKAAAGK